MKLAIGLVLAICVGIGCRWFGIPLPGPPAIMGAAMAVAMASGYTLTDYLLTRRTNTAPSVADFVADPSGVSSPAD
jgi:XapX domain-containing protein